MQIRDSLIVNEQVKDVHGQRQEFAESRNLLPVARRPHGRGHRDYLTTATVQRPFPSISCLKVLSSGIRPSGSSTINRIWAPSGYFVRSAAIPSVTLAGVVLLLTYFASISTSAPSSS